MKVSKYMRFCLSIGWLLLAGMLHAEYEETILPFLDKYCADCHADGVSKGDFSFDDFSGTVSDNKTGERWHEVINVLNEGRMPPEDKPQPDAESKVAVVKWVNDELRRAEVALAGRGSSRVLRRMNRREYEATIEELLGIPPVGTTAFAADGRVQGLDNQGQGLFMSPYQMERYLDTALATLEIALPDSSGMDYQVQIAGEDLTYRGDDFFWAHDYSDQWQRYQKRLAEWEALSNEEKKSKSKPTIRFGVKPESIKWAAENDPPCEIHEGKGIIVYGPIVNRAQLIRAASKLIVRLEIPQDGWYRVKIRAGLEAEKEMDESSVTVGMYPLHKESGRNRGEDPILREEVHGTLDAPETIEKLVYLESGKQNYYLHKGNLGWETEIYTHPQQYAMLNSKRIPRRDFWRGMLVESFAVEGPVSPTKTRQLFFPEGLKAPFSRAKAQAALQNLARRAFRRPVESNEVERFLRFHDDSSRSTFLAGIRKGAAMILSSPKFIYLVEDTSGDNQRLNQHELATRLSYFLWNQSPDDELHQLAGSEKLTDSKVLQKQARRLLSDERSTTFIRSFANGWLGLDRLQGITPDIRRFPTYTFDMTPSLIEQTESFVEEILLSDRSALDMIDSDWTMLNAKLARHYGLDHPGVKGTRLRPVQLSGEDRRRYGGGLTTGAIMTMTSNGTRTSPIVRGAWIVDHLLGDPAPPPPPSVAALEEAEGVTDIESLTVKELIEIHKSDRHCAACHKHFDPYGVAFENYNPAGIWRSHAVKFVAADRFNKPYLRQPIAEIDASGELPDGSRFDGPVAMKQLLLERKDEFARNLISRLLAYALGRPTEFSDRAEIRKLEKIFADADYRIRPLIEAIVMSETFRTR